MKIADRRDDVRNRRAWRIAGAVRLLVHTLKDWRSRAAADAEDLELRLGQLPPHG